MLHSELTRSVRLYPIYAPLAQAYFWLPVFFLYFNEHMPIEQVLRLEAIYYVAVVVLEVPSGYLSDTLGRRLTLLISAVSAIFAYALFFLGGSFGIFVLAQIGLAASMAFRSGTDTSFHYDLLKCLGREDAYPQREARITRNVFIASAGAALLGGAVSIFALRVAYGLSLLAACVAFALVLLFAEPDREASTARQASGFFLQIRACLAYLSQPVLGWLMLFSVFMTVVNHIPYEFYQPYIQLLGGQAPTPLLTGLHTALTMGIAAWFARQSIRLRDHLGTRSALMLSAGVQVVLIALMGFFFHPVVALLLALRSVPRALMIAPLNAAVVPRLQQHHRATYLSIQSLIGRLSFSLCLTLLAGISEGSDIGLSHTLLHCAVFAIAGCVVLAVIAVVIPRSQWRLTN
ncbi:MAG: MFS transporter [Gemmatimonadota bacterium]|nr:MFS transporter [Gemmatimonadota bacterium]MDE2831763.1 MFS transporter [Gemmatimonadota bacterium]